MHRGNTGQSRCRPPPLPIRRRDARVPATTINNVRTHAHVHGEIEREGDRERERERGREREKASKQASKRAKPSQVKPPAVTQVRAGTCMRRRLSLITVSHCPPPLFDSVRAACPCVCRTRAPESAPAPATATAGPLRESRGANESFKGFLRVYLPRPTTRVHEFQGRWHTIPKPPVAGVPPSRVERRQKAERGREEKKEPERRIWSRRII